MSYNHRSNLLAADNLAVQKQSGQRWRTLYSNYSMTKVRARKWRYGRFLPHTGCPVAASPIRKSQPHLCAVSAQGSQLLVVGFHLCQGHADLNLQSLETCHSALGQTHLE